MRIRIFCIMFSGTPVSDAVADCLFEAACSCIIKEKNEKKIYHDDVRGMVHTNFDYGSTSEVSGILFEADVETEKGDTHIKYVVRDHDVEAARKYGKWLRLSPVPAQNYENN